MQLTPELLKSRVKLIDAAVIAYDLGLWRSETSVDHDVQRAYKAALMTNSSSVVEAWNQMSPPPERFPPGLEEHVQTRLEISSRNNHASWVARFVLAVMHNQTRLYEHGYTAYSDLCRRLQAIILTVLPSEASVVRAEDSFAVNMARVTRYRHEEDYVLAAAATLVGTMFVTPRTRLGASNLRGSLTAVPVDWTAVPVSDTRILGESEGPNDMGAPFAEYAVLLKNNTVVLVNTEVGIVSVTPLPVNEQLVWVHHVSSTLNVGSETALYQLTPTAFTRIELPTLPKTNRLDKGEPSITFSPTGSPQLVTLCLASKQLSTSPHEADSVRAEARDLPGAFRNHVYMHGNVVVSLPRSERVAAAHTLESVVDVFTESNDWWRIDTTTKRAVVTGLDVGASIQDAVFVHGASLSDTLQRMNTQ